MRRILNKLYYGGMSRLFFGGRTGLENADAALRYFPISDLIRRTDVTLSILEVGSGCTGITPYIPHQVTGLDVSFEGEIAHRLEPVLLSGESLPFGDSSFAHVVSVDMLEHVPAARRPAVIRELIRVARERLFLAVPCGKKSEAHDRLLDDLYRARHGKSYPFLEEHVVNGLPDVEEITGLIRKSANELGKGALIEVRPNVNLAVREWLTRLWIRSPKAFGLISPLICIFRRLYDFGPCYRSIFIVEIDSGA
ncbi:MAG TPA: class I SAM-dependent methyltransferase [Geobacteraceae bacterium]|nr:class I SAM-dependent methyltransferase [Geobacteraceae bacterium]